MKEKMDNKTEAGCLCSDLKGLGLLAWSRDSVSRLITGITRVVKWLIGAISRPAKPPHPPITHIPEVFRHSFLVGIWMPVGVL